MASTERLRTSDFTILLAVTAGLVVALLYISSSRHRLAYALLAFAMLLSLPRVLGAMLHDPAGIPPHPRSTLLVWLAFLVIVEFGPREKPIVADTGRQD